MILISKIVLPAPGIDRLLREAQDEGYDFVQTLVEDWTIGTNRFNAPGEILCGRLDAGQLVAVGGLNCDPFAASPEIGRIRKVFVRPAWRNQGIGRSLVQSLIEHARTHFRSVRLRAENANAARLYESMGFLSIPSPDATHSLSLDQTSPKALDRLKILVEEEAPD